MPALQLPDAVVVESVRFSAGPFRLEGELAYPEERRPAGAVVLAGPHPLLGGNMPNNVVRALGEGLVHRKKDGFVMLEIAVDDRDEVRAGRHPSLNYSASQT